MIRLSVNMNKVATLRNSRGGAVPDMVRAVRCCLAAGATGITVHPRADQRHIRPEDVRAVARELDALRERVEYNVEGDPRPDLLALVREVRPHQCTLVPVREGELTSQGGWDLGTPPAGLADVVSALVKDGVRVSIFVDAEPAQIRWAQSLGAQRVELYTEPFARAFERGPQEAQRSFEQFVRAAELAHELGLGVNAGHDLDRRNLALFRQLPHLVEVSIGHALISDALFEGLENTVRSYLAALS